MRGNRRAADEIRRRIRAASPAPQARAVWRSLEELADAPRFRRMIAEEFPTVADLAHAPDRRSFIKLMAASFALAGLTGCDNVEGPHAQEVPYVRQPERMRAGALMRYASITLLDGFANGVTVNTRNGRPLKIEGNDAHPWSRGGTDVFGQASVLGLYDPYRSQSVRFLDRISSWESFRGVVTGQFGVLRATGGKGLHVLTGPLTSPTVLAQIEAMRGIYPSMRWHSHAPSARAATYAGTQLAFGRPLETRWRFDKARVVVSLDGDFLDPGPQQVGTSRDWIEARRASVRDGRLLELHAVAPVPSLTSAKADHRAPAGPAALLALVDDLQAEATGQASAGAAGPLAAWRARAAAALREARGQGIVLTGSAQPPALHAAVHRLNATLQNTGNTVFYTAPVQAQAESLAALADAMGRGEVQILVMLDVNPVYDAPADLDFATHLARVRLKIHAGMYDDETAEHADWHLPLAHPLESWGDARSLDGTVGLMQPTIAPLYQGRTVGEILSLLSEPAAPRSSHELLMAHWRGSQDAATFAPKWREALLRGFLSDTALPEEAVQPRATSASSVADPDTGLHVVFRPDPSVWDGAYANISWLQELPKPLTKLTWSNVVTLPPGLARRETIAQGQKVAVRAGGRELTGAAWIMPGQAEDTIGVTLGYGRTALDILDEGAGYDAYALRRAASPWHLSGATVQRLDGEEALATTQHHNMMDGHDFVRVQPVGAPAVGDDKAFNQPRLYDTTKAFTDGRSWGMVIDLDACTGCNACVVACQAENNIPVVGAEQVRAGRVMHWLRVDRYYEGTADNPDTRFLPVPCMQCEDAPCEVGCPVEATLHDHEGLNLQIYNRCIGTRACSSYCPYKVRRFNFYDYAQAAPLSEQQQRNPDVSVRSRGVMEKCTYCVQRIAEARIVADRSNAPIPLNSVQTACQNACPTKAIHFGDLARHDSDVAQARRDPRNYALLGELNTRPHTTYLAAFAPPEARKKPVTG